MDLATAICELSTVYVRRDGSPVYVEHVRARGGELYCALLASMFEDAAELVNVSPWDLVAKDFYESSFRDIRTKDGVGISQVNPRGKWGKAYARDCRPRDEVSCLWAGIKWGAYAYRAALDECGGEWAAMGRYRTRACIEGPRGRRVLELRDWLRGKERSDA